MLVNIYDDLVRKVLSLMAPGLLAQWYSGRTSKYLPSSNNCHSIYYIANLFFFFFFFDKILFCSQQFEILDNLVYVWYKFGSYILLAVKLIIVIIN